MQDEIMEDNTGDDGRRSGSEESQTPAVAATTTDSSASLAQETNGHGADPTHDIRDLEDRISYSLHTFDEAPFTIQRIAELLAWPERHYRNVLKFLRAVERVVYVTSTVDEFPPCMQNDGAEEAQNDCETQSASNGATATPSTMFSLVASQKEEPSSQQTDKGADPAALSARSESAGSDNSGTRQPEDDSQLSSDATDKAKWAATSAPGIPPLDASDTGIVHIASTAEDEDATRTRIQKVVDSTVPVCIDVPGDTDGKITVVPVHPASSSDEQQHN
ncbi:hypothetical protein IWW50_006135 [Coemansia erecta]|nr:hypothetical protein IWW50_006135 [Coemansia erecta]